MSRLDPAHWSSAGPYPPHGVGFVRHSDTSEAAAVAMKPSAATLREQVLAYIASKGSYGATDDEGEHALQFAGNTYRPRRRDLELDGKVVKSGAKRETASGRMAVVWVAAP